MQDTASKLNQDLDALFSAINNANGELVLRVQDKLFTDINTILRPTEQVLARIGHDSTISTVEIVHLRGWLRSILQDHIKLTSTFFLPFPDVDPVITSFQTSLDEYSSLVPEQHEFENDRAAWIDKAPGTAVTGFWKIFQRVKDNLGKDDSPFSRTVPVRSVLLALIELDLYQIRSHCWFSLLSEVNETVQKIHDASLHLTEGILLKDETSAVSPFETFENSLKSFAELLNALKQDFQNHAEVETNAMAEQLSALTARGIEFLPYAGTSLLPGRRWQESTRRKRLHTVMTSQYLMQKRWEKRIHGERSEWKKDLELMHAGVSTSLDLYRHRKMLHQTLLDDVLPVHKKLSQSVNNTLQEVTNLIEAGFKENLDDIQRLSRNLIIEIRRKHMPDLTEQILQATFDRIPLLFSQKVSNSIEKLPEKQPIFQERTSQYLSTQLIEVELRAIIRNELYHPLENNLNLLSSDVNIRQGRILQLLSDLDHVLDVNVTAGYNLLQERLRTKNDQEEGIEDSTTSLIMDESVCYSQAATIFREGFTRLQERIKDIEDKLTDLVQNCDRILVDSTIDFETSLQKLTQSQEFLELKLRYAKGIAQKRILETRRNILQSSRKMVLRVLTSVPELLEWLRRRYTGFRKLTGLTEITSDSEYRLAAFLRETDRIINELPFVYKQLFKAVPLEEDRFFTSRSEELQQFEEQVRLWQDGHLASFAIVGELGSGKTSLLSIAENRVDASILRRHLRIDTGHFQEDRFTEALCSVFSIDPVKTLEEFERNLSTIKQDRCICILEDLHRIYMRTIDGFTLLEKLMLLINRTGDRILWIISCNQFAWAYLDKAVGISKSIQRVIPMNPFKSNEMRELIRKRHQASGYRSAFEVPEELQKSRKYRRLRTSEKQEEAVRDHYFRRLNELSSGNIRTALLFYLRSIRVDENNTLLICTITFDETFLQGLDNEDLFTITAIVQHGGLTEEQHAAVFRSTVTKSRTILSHLQAKGIILRNERDSFYLHPFIYHQAIRELKENNLLSYS